MFYIINTRAFIKIFFIRFFVGAYSLMMMEGFFLFGLCSDRSFVCVIYLEAFNDSVRFHTADGQVRNPDAKQDGGRNVF